MYIYNSQQLGPYWVCCEVQVESSNAIITKQRGFLVEFQIEIDLQRSQV